jgi:16S rRNA (uracil1498-N3)-methyltransferase
MPFHFLADGLGAARVGESVHLTGEEAHHAAAVRRVRPGEEVTVGDGHGIVVHGRCRLVSPREVTIDVERVDEIPPASPRTVLVQALAKGHRDEQAVEAATELGVSAVVPWQAARSVVRWDDDRAERGLRRWRAIAREASKQSHRAWLPEVGTLETTAGIVARCEHAAVLLLDPEARRGLVETARTAAVAGAAEIVLIVGPEGGIAADEERVLTASGATPVRLGDTVLRTSTAGPAALVALHAAQGRW